MAAPNPTEVALHAVSRFPDSAVEVGMAFSRECSPQFWNIADNDRFVKLGRSLVSLVKLKEKIDFNSSVERLVQDCNLLVSGNVTVPKVRFGKTELDISILTLGCMRFQQEWGPRITNLDMVGADCQDNLERIITRAMSFGINHIETARTYGCSELQLGVALKHLMAKGVMNREDFILQTKAHATATAAEFRKTLETSFRLLQVDYVDLFSFHGCNMSHQFDWIFNNGENGNCFDVVQEYIDAGKIKHVGFSTHAPSDLVEKFIRTDKFEYVNLHYHFCGSYTTTGYPQLGNRGNVELLKEKDMGVFIISAMDKGGKLYAPSNKLRSLCLPDMEPMEYGVSWLWNHEKLMGSPIHTCVVGAARAADLDEPSLAAFRQDTSPDETFAKVQTIEKRLKLAEEEALGTDWISTCYSGILKSHQSAHQVEHNQIIWCHNVIKAWGLLAFAKDRYGTLESNKKQWDDKLSVEENIEKRKGPWGFTPGLPLDEGKDYTDDDLMNVPDGNKAKVIEAEAFVKTWCGTKIKPQDNEGSKDDTGKKKDEEDPIPFDWQTAYEMKPWKDFPDRPSTA